MNIYIVTLTIPLCLCHMEHADVDLTLRRKWRHLYRDALKKFGPVAWIELESKYKLTYCNINKKPDRKLMFNQKN